MFFLEFFLNMFYLLRRNSHAIAIVLAVHTERLQREITPSHHCNFSAYHIGVCIAESVLREKY